MAMPLSGVNGAKPLAFVIKVAKTKVMLGINSYLLQSNVGAGIARMLFIRTKSH
jgi:hypothetical protein